MSVLNVSHSFLLTGSVFALQIPYRQREKEMEIISDVKEIELSLFLLQTPLHL